MMRQHLPVGLHQALAVWLFLLATLASAGPSQFCRPGLGHAQADFCMAVSLYHNHSTAAHDLYLRLDVRRPAADGAARLGWTAIGTGSRMHGSLMFVVYGDPEEQEGQQARPRVGHPAQEQGQDRARAQSPPVLSLRTTEKKHSRPVSIRVDHKALDVRVLDAKWTRSTAGGGDVDDSGGTNNTEAWTAELSVVCYGCSDWDGDAIAVESTSQPWIWAWNKDQDMSPYAEDIDLQRHDLLDGQGFGTFYVDMKSAATHHADDAMPAILRGRPNIQTSETPIPPAPHPAGLLSLFDSLKQRPLAHLHGFLMSTAFLVLFPAGAAAIRSPSSRAFTHHWTIQLTAILFALTGAATAVYMTGGDLFGSPHQIAGSSISVLLLVQAALGWRHHFDFVRIRRRTAISYGHISLGILLLVGGWLNVLGGMVLFGYGRLTVFLAAGLVAAEALCVGGWSLLAARRRRRAEAAKESPDTAAAYFALDDIDSEDEDEDEDADVGGHRMDRPAEEQKGLMKKSIA